MRQSKRNVLSWLSNIDSIQVNYQKWINLKSIWGKFLIIRWLTHFRFQLWQSKFLVLMSCNCSRTFPGWLLRYYCYWGGYCKCRCAEEISIVFFLTNGCLFLPSGQGLFSSADRKLPSDICLTPYVRVSMAHSHFLLWEPVTGPYTTCVRWFQKRLEFLSSVGILLTRGASGARR